MRQLNAQEIDFIAGGTCTTPPSPPPGSITITNPVRTWLVAAYKHVTACIPDISITITPKKPTRPPCGC